MKGHDMNLRTLFENSPHTQVFQAGQTIFASGDSGKMMYVILDGSVEVVIPNGLVEILQPGELFGEMALVETRPRVATAKAKTDCRLAQVDEQQFLFMVSETPFFALHVMRVLAERLRRTEALTIPAASR
jgi:CRP-like cAMP-binding protein